MDKDLSHDRQAHINREVSEDLPFKVLIQEDAKAQPLADKLDLPSPPYEFDKVSTRLSWQLTCDRSVSPSGTVSHPLNAEETG